MNNTLSCRSLFTFTEGTTHSCQPPSLVIGKSLSLEDSFWKERKLKFSKLVWYLNLPFQVPRNRYWGLHPPPKPLEDVVDDGLMAIQRATFLIKAGVETLIDDGFLSNPPSRADLLESAIKNITRCSLSLSHTHFLISFNSCALPCSPILFFFYR